MRIGGAGSRRVRRRWAAALALAVATLLVVAWPPVNPGHAPAAMPPVISDSVAMPGFSEVNRRVGLAALAHCDACHAPGDMADDRPLALASTLRAVRRDEPAPDDDVKRVRSGGAIFASTCASCHATRGTGSTRVGTVGVEPQATIGTPPRSLSDEQVAALLAFLRRHLAALPQSAQSLRTTL